MLRLLGTHKAAKNVEEHGKKNSKMLKIQNISKTFHMPHVRALKNITLSVDASEFFLVHGPSGCGKTTLLLTAAGLLRPDTGRVEIGGRDPYQLSPDARSALRAGSIGFVFQQFHLVPYLSVKENIASPALALSADEDAEERTYRLLRQFGLHGRRDHLPPQLSSGERQRTALARAMFNNPGIIMADEPTGNLDSANAEIVYTSLQSFTENGGAVLLVSHDERVRGYATQSVEMEGGRLG